MTPSERIAQAAAFDDKWVAWRRSKDDSLARDWLHGAATENARLAPLIAALAKVAECAERVHSASGYIDTHTAHEALDEALAALDALEAELSNATGK